MSSCVQLFINEEDLLCSRHLKNLLGKLVPAHDKDFALDRVSCREIQLPELLRLLNTTSFLGGKRTVVASNLEALSKEAAEVLGRYLASPNPETNAIFVTTKIDKRTALYKAFARLGEVVEFKKPYPNRIPEIVGAESKRLGLSLAPGVAQLLVDTAGTDLTLLVTELEKLALYASPRTQLTQEDVAQLTGTGIVDNVWQLGELVANRDLAGSVGLFERILLQGDSVVALTAIVTGHFRKLKLARCAPAGTPEEALATLIGVPAFFARQYFRQACHFTPEKLNTAYRSLMRLSEDLRGGGLSPKALFNHFLTELCLDH